MSAHPHASRPGLDSPLADARAWFDRRGVYLVMQYGVPFALLVTVIYFAFSAPDFLSVRNLQAIGYAASITGVLACAFTVALVAGQIDLTVGVTMGLLATVFEIVVVRNQHSLVLGLAAMLAMALLVGIGNGLIVVNVGVNSVVATFAGLSFLLGASSTLFNYERERILSSGEFTATLAPGRTGWELVELTSKHILGVPVPVLVLGLVAALCYLLLSHAKTGAHLYATGANPSAALRAGIRVNALIRFVFLLTPIAALLGALMTIGREGTINPSTGYGAEFDVLTAVLIGGASFFGGGGSIQRTLLGVLFIVVLRNGLTIDQVAVTYQYIAIGSIFLVGVVISAVAAKQKAR
jgi:ribose/xylose/arabinose/galactoside ABC-type transport system permease subunit